MPVQIDRMDTELEIVAAGGQGAPRGAAQAASTPMATSVVAAPRSAEFRHAVMTAFETELTEYLRSRG